MIKELQTVAKMVKVRYSSKYAMEVANQYWQNTIKTHGSMDDKNFDFYYKGLLEILNPKKDDLILDYGGGSGEISFRFKENGFFIEHCDLSRVMVERAKSTYQLESCLCVDLRKRQYDKILFNNAFFYVHPSFQEKVLKNLFNHLKENGRLYITDTPDFDKRDKLNLSKLQMLVTKVLGVYQVDLSGFFIRDKTLISLATRIGFKVEKRDSWCDYRSHWILSRDKSDK